MLMYLVKQVELAIRSRLDDLLRPDGLTALQFTALTVLERHPDLSSAQLARNSFVTAQSMADMITTLQGRDLHRTPPRPGRPPTTGRRAHQGGRELLDRYRDEVTALEAQMLAGLTASEISALRDALRACRASLGGHPPR